MTIFASDALQGKHAIVTGATGGIGRAIARQLLRMGADVTLTGRDRARLAELQEEIAGEHPSARVKTVAAELTREEDRIRLVREAELAHGPVSLLVNNAGVYKFGTVEELTEDDLEELMRINFTSAVLFTQLVYEGMKKRKEGAVVNVSSLSGLRGNYGSTAYSASKFALIGFTHCFAVEAIRHNVRVNAVCPGFVDTDMGHHVIRENAAVRGETYERQLALTNAGIPSGRITTAEEVANAVAFLLTEASGNIVGESLKISGGAVLR
ncbi:SDR family NAD(P)-dependent oxidoreductase [Paenibacillus sp. 32O-W]|uniref:SDR family NAD(P)-dependent oxidoreductase n=1 Tax=Paenibacillus sp. 32O-W TaxID=1695218 RepID=UPI0007859DE4|nr:SDR family NAD(P)-dependent oxidoreductase [Paenibacillus sp. 32O-W]